ncbi:cation-independent mannose-6-phosphate receptor [Anopheles nili]|uniref:cation-independent mannose-6-phosphate receptor n=1 Tax=Anopheles nili TaxID=185578 RepID=UPI00237C4A80|nr:cation-independent mannose-6-phosphate receptor [Anopheles nili]
MASRRVHVGRMSCGTVRLLICSFAVAVTTFATAAQSKLLLNGTGCTIREPMYNVTFDFNALSSDLNHHVTSEDNGERFFFNVCDGTDTKAGEPQAYLVRPAGRITLGYEAHLQLDDGRLQFSFVGESCGHGANYSLDIVLLCSYERTPEGLRVIPHTPDQCRYFIFWDTPLACQPLPKALNTASRCAVKEGPGGHEYNLQALAGANHEVPLLDGSRFVLSVCKPVRYGHLTMCPPGAGVCLVNGTTYTDLGQAVATPTIDGTGRLVMMMRSGAAPDDPCRGSRILFECGSDELAAPEYLGQPTGCGHEFRWRTPDACRDTRPCTVSNPITGTRYDLGLLANRTYRLATANGSHTYELGVCHIPASSQCALDSGACEITGTQSVGLGVISNELHYDTTGAPYLLYRSGAICDAKTKRRWETRLEFICETDPVEGGHTGAIVPPIVVENGDCQLVVHFETVLVCEPALMACGAYNESTIDQYVDLTPLADAASNYEALVGPGVFNGALPTKRYFLNVCRPLVPQFGLSCRGGAAACEATFDGVTARNETTLGFPDVSLVVAGQTVLMKYLRGDPCRADPLTNLSTTVSFRCVPAAGLGRPVLVEIEHECHYRFEWATGVICPPEVGLVFEKSNCTVRNGATGGEFGLDKLIPGGPSLCDKQPIASVDYHLAVLNVYFTVAENCSSSQGTKTYNLTINCGTDSPLERSKPSNCSEVIKKQTPTVCALVGRKAAGTAAPTTLPTIITPGTDEPTHTPDVTKAPSTTSEPVGTHVTPEGGVGAFGVVLICLSVFVTLGTATWYLVWRHPDRRRQMHDLLLCRGNARDGFPRTMYSRVDNGEVSSLLLNPANILSDSDDDMLI